MKKIYLFLLLVLSVFGLSSCDQFERKPTERTDPTETKEIPPTNKHDENVAVKLLYSGSSISTNGSKEFIDNYEDYLFYGYNLELEESFFENNILYTYSFLNNNIGSELYKLYSFSIVNKTLNIELKENMIASSPAFGGHTLVFSIEKDYFKLVENINVSGVWGKDDKEKYYLFIDDEMSYIINELDLYYYHGDEIIIQTHVLTDVSLELYINDEFHSTQTAVETNNGYIWEYYLIMPNKDIKISFKVVDGFLPYYKPLDTITFANDDYNYKNVYSPAGSLLEHKDYFLQKYNLNLNEDVVVVEDYYAFSEIYEILMGEPYLHDLTPEEFVWILVYRLAGGSQFISIDYYFYDTFIGYNYPYGKAAGDAAIFSCLDVITILKEDFNNLESLEFNIIEETIPIDDKIYWQGSIDDNFTDNEVIICIDGAFTAKKFTIDDFKDFIDIEEIELLTYNSSYDENDPFYDTWRNVYLITLKNSNKEKVIEAINILITSKYIYYAGPNGILEIDDPVEIAPLPDNYLQFIKARMQFINEDGSYNDYYGGAYVENQNEFIICVYGDYVPIEYEGIIYKYVEYSYNYFLSIMEEATNFATDYSIVLIGIDEKENKLLIQLKDELDVSLIINRLDELIEDFDANSIHFDVNPEGEIILT